MHATDKRSVPDRLLNLFLYPIAAWGLALLGCYFAGRAAWAILLCFPLALWFGALTLYWGMRSIRAMGRGDLTPPEVNAGVRSIGHILAAASLSPGIVFLAADPLSSAALSTTVGVVAVAAIAWLLCSAAVRLSNRYFTAVVLTLAWLALPLNAGGAVTAATLTGLYDRVGDVAPLPGLGSPDERPDDKPPRGKRSR